MKKVARLLVEVSLFSCQVYSVEVFLEKMTVLLSIKFAFKFEIGAMNREGPYRKEK